MPTFCNADRFLATNIANFRYVKPSADDTAALRNAATSASKNPQSNVAILPSGNPRASQPSVSNKNGKTLSTVVTAAGTGSSKGVDLGASLKSFFQIFFGTTEEQKKVTPKERIEKGNSIFKDVMEWCKSERTNIEGDEFKSAVIDSFDSLQQGQKSNFLARYKKFLGSIGANENRGEPVKSHPLFQIAETIYRVCNGRYVETSHAAQSMENEAASTKEKTILMPTGAFQVADFPESWPEEDINALVIGKA